MVLPEREEAAYVYDDLINLGLESNTLFFPSSYKRSVQFGQPDKENLVLRTEALNKISGKGKNFIIVTYPEGLVEKVVSRENLH